MTRAPSRRAWTTRVLRDFMPASSATTRGDPISDSARHGIDFYAARGPRGQTDSRAERFVSGSRLSSLLSRVGSHQGRYESQTYHMKEQGALQGAVIRRT